jgi:hypothetical protein
VYELIADRLSVVGIGYFCGIITSSNVMRAGAKFYAFVVRRHGGAKEETVGGSVSLDKRGAGVASTARAETPGSAATLDTLSNGYS